MLFILFYFIKLIFRYLSNFLFFANLYLINYLASFIFLSIFCDLCKQVHVQFAFYLKIWYNIVILIMEAKMMQKKRIQCLRNRRSGRLVRASVICLADVAALLIAGLGVFLFLCEADLPNFWMFVLVMSVKTIIGGAFAYVGFRLHILLGKTYELT